MRSEFPGRPLRLLASLLLVAALAAVLGVGVPESARASGVFSGTAHSNAVTVDSVSGDISIREWLSAASGTHSGGDFSSSADASFSLVVPSSVAEMDVLAFGGGGGGGGGTQSNGFTTFGGGGGGGGGEVRRIDGLSVSAGETLTVTAGKAGTGGAANSSGSAGGDTSLKRGSTTLLNAKGGAGGQRAGDGRAGGSGGSGGSGGTLVSAGIDGRNGSGTDTSPTDMSPLNNSGSSWVIGGLRIAAGGGGGGGRQVPSGSGTDYSQATRATTAAAGFTASSDRIGGDGEGGNNAYTTTSQGRIDAFEYSGSGGGGGGAVFSNHGAGGGYGGSGGLIFSYVLADLDTSSLSAAAASIRANSSTTITLQLKNNDVSADVSAGPVAFSISGVSGASLSSVTDNGDGTYSATLSSGGVEGTATVSATIDGESFSDTASVVVSRLAQTVTWSPPSSQTTLELADSGLTIDAASTTGDGSLTYSVSNAGTTGCSISGSRAVTFSGVGTCVLSASASETDTYGSAATSVSFTVLQGTFAISSPSSKVGTSASSFTDVCTSSCDVSGFAAADEILVVVNKSDGSALSGRVRLDSDTGLDDVTGYTTTPTGAAGYDEIAFVGTQAEVNAALETLQYKSPTGGGDESLGISASLSGAAYFAGTGHYYEVINVGATVNWEDARCRAKYGNSSAHDDSSGLTQSDDDCTNTSSRRTLNGLQGYLANITSLDEHNFLRTKLSDVGWIGGADVDTEGTFLWMDGPEAGETFFVAGTSSRRTTNTIDGEDQFNYFSDGEPNNSSDEDFVEFGFGSDGVGSSWNDCKNGCNRTKFVIEYGEDGDSPIKQASTTFTVGAPTAPLQVTGASATAGNNQVALSWSAPDSGGSAITDYVIEQLDSDGSTWNTLADGVSTSTSFTVTGLTNGTSYSFRVSAKNTIGTGTVSSTVSATPAVPAPSGGGSSGGTTVTPAPVVAPATPAVPRIITPTQPTPRPSVLGGPVSSPGRGFDPNTGTRATVGGAPATVVKRALPGGVSVQTGAFQFGVSLGGNEENTVDDGVSDLGVAGGGTAKVTGSGMLPGSPVQVWLPGPTGTEPRELARATVNEDGQVEADLAFVAKPSDTAIAIGPQVMQVTGYDDDGNLTVVDMTINVSQGPITPEPDRSEGALPALSVGSSLATSAGIPTPVTVVPLSEEKRVSIGDGSWTLLVDVDPETGVVGGTPEAPVVQVTQDSVGSASGEGFMPGTTASVWMFSDPTLLGTVTVGDDGSFTTEFQVDSTYLPAGTHTLQVQGVGDDGYIKAANLGVDVQAPADLTSTGSSGLLWWVAGIFALLLAALFLAIMRRRRGDRVPTR